MDGSYKIRIMIIYRSKSPNQMKKTNFHSDSVAGFAAAQNSAVFLRNGGNKQADELFISVTDDHSRITLKAENNHGNSDYINASPIVSIVCVL